MAAVTPVSVFWVLGTVGKNNREILTPEPIAVARANSVRTGVGLDHMPYLRVGMKSQLHWRQVIEQERGCS